MSAGHSSVGRPKKIESLEDFIKYSESYIQWVLNNPVEKTITASFQGIISHEKVPHARPMTQHGWASHLGIGLSTLKDYGQRPEFSATFSAFADYMTAYNIDGATSGDFSGNIVSRIEGLADKKETNISGELEVKTLSGMMDELSADET